ncbi:hypothetical protein [Brevibacterium litoralis]|uniref:hypothetical protein n=1 Tax=Brevibacterium litoralis TaxID=3138935 RepID=UPI0032EBB748
MRTGQIDAPAVEVTWHSNSGEAVFAPTYLEHRFARTDTKAVFVVPDPRIGNRSVHAPDHPLAFKGIDQSVIDPQTDSAVYGRGVSALHAIRRANPSCRFIFWSLAGREMHNRREGRYVVDGTYRHPTWNLAETEAECGDATISLQGLLHDRWSSALHVDAGGHPSWYGLRLLMSLIENPAADALEVFHDILATSGRPVFDAPEPTVYSGTSHWLRTVQEYAQRGIVSLGPNIHLCTSKDIVAGRIPSSITRACYITRTGSNAPADAHIVEALINVVNHLHAQCPDSRVVLWDRAAVMAADTSFPWSRSEITEDDQGPYAALRPFAPEFPTIESRDIEKVSPWIQPTLDGLIALHRSLGGSVEWEPFPDLR